VLKLSSGEVDMSRSRAIDDRMRSQLRDRQLVLDSDDQVAALLALRNSVRQLESKVAELQLKLSGMPSSFPPPRPVEKAAPPPPPPPIVAAAPPPIVAATPPPVVAAAPPPVVTKAPEPPSAPRIEPPPPVPAPVEAPPAPAAKSEAAPVPAATAQAKPVTKPSPGSDSLLKPAVTERDETTLYLWWGLGLVLLMLAALLAWRLSRRRREFYDYEDSAIAPDLEPEPQPEPEDDQIVVADEHHREETIFEEEALELPHEPARRELDSDVDLATRLGENTDDLRRRYIEERFPEIANRAIVLDDPDSVVKGARLFYEDGAIARAVELLQYGIERNPKELKTWLALFEIFRLERLTGEFAGLARRFKEHHGKGDYWRKVQYFGREIDPGNTLYQEDVVNTFETIGPSEARRLATIGATVDPIAENWLGAPMDFENEVFANELRKTLMAEARINEQDLTPNPMPALRNVEMFTVA
jgi:hypothetical protein